MPKAFSYQRFSDDKQASGDSIRRQTALREAYLARHPELVLDESDQWTDEGVSAHRSKNAGEDNGLGKFLAEIKAGTVPPGSVLLIENLDRLSRDKIGVALTLFISILNSGVRIVTLQPEREYTSDSINDVAGILEPIISMVRAHEESAVKSQRIAASWKARRDGVAKGKKIVIASWAIPGWIRPNADGTDYELIPERAAVVRKIFALAAEGYGTKAIAKKLMDAGVEPIGRRSPKQDQPHWEHSYVWKIINNRQVLGEYQPKRIDTAATSKRGKPLKKGRQVPVGDPIPGYYPRVVGDDLFNRVQAAVKGRVRHRGRKGNEVANLFTGLLVDARDHRHFHFQNRSRYGNTYHYLINEGAVRGEKDATFISFPYPVFEKAFLLATKELTPEALRPVNGDAVAEIAQLSGRLAEINATIAKTKARVKEGGKSVDALLDLIVDLEQERRTVQATMDTLQLATSDHATRTLKSTQDHVKKLEACKTPAERTDLRERIRGRIRAMVDRIYLLIWPGKKVKHLLAQIHFFNGSIRVLYLHDQWDDHLTLLNPQIVPKRDLRNYREKPWKLGEVKV
jgi:DNA invertase Pin-like site-specific DNA recombinase